MTVSPSTTLPARRFALVLAGLALSVAACADVGSSDLDDATSPSPASDETICQSIRSTMEVDKKAAEAAEAAGNKTEAAKRREQVVAGAQGASTVKGCDVSDLVPPSSVPPLPTDGASPAASPSKSS